MRMTGDSDTKEAFLTTEDDNESRILTGLFSCGIEKVNLEISETGQSRWVFTLHRTPREAQKLWEIRGLEVLWGKGL